MSTLSFQDYVRERMLKRRQAALQTAERARAGAAREAAYRCRPQPPAASLAARPATRRCAAERDSRHAPARPAARSGWPRAAARAADDAAAPERACASADAMHGPTLRPQRHPRAHARRSHAAQPVRGLADASDRT